MTLEKMQAKLDSANKRLSPHVENGAEYQTLADIYEFAFDKAEEVAIDAMKEIVKLQAFKDYVHNKLTEMGVPENPNPEKVEKTGCRIECRLEWIQNK